MEKMREEFLTLHPCDEPYHAAVSAADDLQRRSSTDVLDSKQMKTMILEYPDAGSVFFQFSSAVKGYYAATVTYFFFHSGCSGRRDVGQGNVNIL